MSYYSVKEIEEMVSAALVDVYVENKWIVLVFETGIRIKIVNF